MELSSADCALWATQWLGRGIEQGGDSCSSFGNKLTKEQQNVTKSALQDNAKLLSAFWASFSKVFFKFLPGAAHLERCDLTLKTVETGESFWLIIFPASQSEGENLMTCSRSAKRAKNAGSQSTQERACLHAACTTAGFNSLGKLLQK